MKKLCLFGLTSNEAFIKDYICSDTYYVKAIVSNENIYTKFCNCCYYSFDNVDLSWITKNCDEVIIFPANQCSDLYLYKCIVELLDANMTVINQHRFSTKYMDMLSQLEKNVKHGFINKVFLDKDNLERCSTVPVVYVTGIEDDIDNLKLEMGIVFELLSRGYEVQWYSSCNCGEIFGANTYSECAYLCDSLDLFRNEMYKMMDSIEAGHFDVVVLGVPASWCTRDTYTLKARLLSYYFSPDYITLGIYHNSLENNTIESLVSYTEPFLGKKADMLVLTSGIVDIVKYEIVNPYRILHTEHLNDYLSELEGVEDILQDNYSMNIVDDIEERLT